MIAKTKIMAGVFICVALLCAGSPSAMAAEKNSFTVDESDFEAEAQSAQQAVSPAADGADEAALKAEADSLQPEPQAQAQAEAENQPQARPHAQPRAIENHPAAAAATVAKPKVEKRAPVIPMPSPEVLALPNEVLGGDNYEWLTGGLVFTAAFFFGFAYFLWRRLQKKPAALAFQPAPKHNYWDIGNSQQG